MWDDHTCKAAASRVAEMAPTVNQTAAAARKKGMLIIHAPSGRTSFLRQHAAAQASQGCANVKSAGEDPVELLE